MFSDYAFNPSEHTTTLHATKTIERVTIICVSLACVSVALRLWSKLHHGKRQLGVDDGAMIAALFFFVWVCILVLNLVAIEYQNPVLTAPVADAFLLRLTIAEVIFMIDTVFLKVSLLVYYRQFVWQKWQRQAIWAAGICSIVISTVALFLALFQCGTPTNLAWKHMNGHCMPREVFLPFLYVHGVFSALTDWAFALLPIAVLVKSSLRPAIKASVCLLLALGVLGSIAACFRTVFVPGIWFEPIFLDPSHQPDFYTYSATEICLALIELGFGISAASLACLQPLLRKFGHKTKSWFHGHKHLVSWKQGSPDGSSVSKSQFELPTINDSAAVVPSVPSRRRGTQRSLPVAPPRIPTRDRRCGFADQIPGRKASIGVLPSFCSADDDEDDCSVGGGGGGGGGEGKEMTLRADADVKIMRLGMGVLPSLMDTVFEKEETETEYREKEKEWRRSDGSVGVGVLSTFGSFDGYDGREEEVVSRVDSGV